MTSKSPQVPSAGNFMQSFVNGNIIKFLDDEFDKFEAKAKNCDRYTVLDVKLPVRIIELFLRLFQLCVDNPVLRQNIDSVELFAKIFLLMRTHFKAQCPCGLDVDYEEDDSDDEDDWGECCETDPMKRFFHYISHQQVKQTIGLEEASKKKLLKDVKHAKDWLLEQDGIMICEICNAKSTKLGDILTHAKQASHEKNLDLYKENELYAAFPDSKTESYGCKACKSEYSTFSSLVKHFDKPQHVDGIQKLLVSATKKADDIKSSNNATKSTSNVQIQPVVKNTPNTGTSEEKQVNVMIKYKTKKATIVATKTCGDGATKPLVKNPTNVTSKTETKLTNNVSAISANPQAKNTTNVASKTETKLTNNVSAISANTQSKNTTNVASKTETKLSNNVSAISANLQAKNATSVAPKTESKPSDNKPSKINDSKPASKTSTPADKAPTAKPTKPEYSLKFIVSKDSSGKFCQICNCKLPDEAAIIAHAKGSAHLKMMSTFEANQEYVKTSINCDDLLCIMCGEHFPDIHELACHFKEKQHVNSVKVKSPPKPSPAPPKPVQKPAAKIILKNAQLNDTDKKYLRQKGNLAQCIICDVTFNVIGDVIDHINGQQHSQNVIDCIKYEEYVQLPVDKTTSFNCLKCTSIFDSFSGILTHCKDHINAIPKAKPAESFKLKKSDEKFISKGKTEKSSRCNLCDKELPTEAALISHTGSSNHVKNCNVIIKNETYFTAGKTSCSLCEHNSQDLASLVKHFKTDTHQKAAIKGKKPLNQTSIHIPSYAKPKLDQIMVTSAPAKSPKLATPKKDKKIEDTTARKSRLQLFSMSDVNFDELTSCDQFPMKKPDNSYIIAKNDVFYCRICDVDLPAVTVAAHMNGATHRINAEVFESLQCHVSSTSDCVRCTLCKLSFDHVHQLIKHFREKIHAKPAELEKTKSPDPVPVFVFGATENKPEETPVPDSTPSSAENKPTEQPNVLSKPIKIPKSDRKHIFRLAETVVQCNLCNTKLDNSALESHINNLNHKRNSVVYQENELLIKQVDSVGSLFECTKCMFSADLNKVIKHCKKKQHLVAKGCEEVVSDDEILPEKEPDQDLTITEFDIKCIFMKNGIVRCKICHSKLTGEKNLLEHMNSINHKNFSAIYKRNEQFIEQFDELGYSYKCIICEVIFTRLDTMIRHFSEEGHFQTTEETQIQLASNDNTRFNVTTYDFECILCSMTFKGFADLSKHCYSPQHEVLKNLIQSEQNEIPYNITITDYQYHCNACDIRLLNQALMEKHQKKRIHEESATFFRESSNGQPIIEIVGYEYLCNLCWFPMYSAAELAVHERSNMHKSGKSFDDVWRFNEKHLIMCESMYKVRCKLCLKTIGIEKLIKHCTSRDHRLKFIANHLEENAQDQYIVWRNSTQYCTLCDCKLINNHNLVNHVNSEKHKLKLLQN